MGQQQDEATVGDMRIRPAVGDDAESVLSILRSAPVPPEEAGVDRDQATALDELREGLAAPEVGPLGKWLVLEEGEPIGFIAIGEATDSEGGPEASAYLAEAARGEGRGPALLEDFMVPHATRAGVERLTATPTTMTAVRLLKKHGFQVRAREKPLPTGDATADALHSHPVEAPGIPWDRALT